MKISYDAAADAAYIRIVDVIDPGQVDKTYLCDPHEVGGMVNIDLDGDGRILGVEVLTASALLAAEVLAKADPQG